MSKKSLSTTSGVLWERQPKESSEAWEAFHTYLSLGVKRSTAKVGQQLGKKKDLMDRWSSKWNWVERVRAHDNFLMAQEDRAQLLEARKRAINYGKLADDIFKAQKNYILYLSAKDPATFTRGEVDALMKMGDTLYRDHRDMFSLTAQEQAELELQHERLNLEIARLEAAQPTPATEQGGSNFIEALNANAADFFPKAAGT